MSSPLCSSRYRLAIATLLMLPWSGCARWKQPAEKPLVASGTSTHVADNKRRLMLDVEFANLDSTTDPEAAADLWEWVDETAVAPETRGRLLANGIRTGIVSDRERFRRLLSSRREETDVVDQFLSQASISSDLSQGNKRFPMRFGRRYELVLRQPIQGEHTTLIRLDGETHGRTLAHAQHVMAVTASKSDRSNQADLRLQFEIQHGEARPKFVSSDTALRIDSRRETWSLSELDIHLTASEGDTIVVGPASPLAGLAREMLSGEASDHRQEQMVLLLTVDQIPSAVDQL